MRSRLRKLALQCFSRVNPGDIKIRNVYTGDRLSLHSFKHKGYWYNARRREAATMARFQELLAPGDTVVEVGGHIGYLTQLFAHRVGASGHVVVFEPGANNLPYLERNIGSLDQVELIRAGAGDTEGEATLFMESLTGQNNSFVADFAGLRNNEAHAGVHATISPKTVQLTTIDHVVAQRSLVPTLIKIDVEGFELSVLRGAAATLAEHHPIVMAEIQAHHEEIAEMATAAGYQVFDDRLTAHDWTIRHACNTFWFHDQAHAEVLREMRDRLAP